MIIQLNPAIPLDTPKGPGLCHFLIDYGPESHLYWVVILDSNGEVWTFENPEVRGQNNPSVGRRLQDDPVKWVDEAAYQTGWVACCRSFLEPFEREMVRTAEKFAEWACVADDEAEKEAYRTAAKVLKLKVEEWQQSRNSTDSSSGPTQPNRMPPAPKGP